MRRKITLSLSTSPPTGGEIQSARLDRLAPTLPALEVGCIAQTKAIGGDDFIVLLKHFAKKIRHSATEQEWRGISLEGSLPPQSGAGIEANRREWEEWFTSTLSEVKSELSRLFQTDYPTTEGDIRFPLTPQLKELVDVLLTEKRAEGKATRFEVLLAAELWGSVDELFDRQKLEEAFGSTTLEEFLGKIGEAIKVDNEGRVQKVVYDITRTTQKALGLERDDQLPEVLAFLKSAPSGIEIDPTPAGGDTVRLGKQPAPDELPPALFGLVVKNIYQLQQRWNTARQTAEVPTLTIPTPWDF